MSLSFPARGLRGNRATTLDGPWAPGTRSVCSPGSASALGVVFAGLLGAGPRRAVLAALLGAVGGRAARARARATSEEAIAGAVGGLLGGFGAAPIVARRARARRDARRRRRSSSRSRGSVVAALAFVPIVGYVDAGGRAGARPRGSAGGPAERYAGLRILARD